MWGEGLNTMSHKEWLKYLARFSLEKTMRDLIAFFKYLRGVMLKKEFALCDS